MYVNPTCVIGARCSAALALMFLVLGVMLWPADPARAQESRAADLDPVVAEILAMLDAGVDEGVILQWLESTDRRPADVGSQGLIALAEAEASEEFVKTLLTRVEDKEADPPDLAAPPPPAAPRSVEPTVFTDMPGAPGPAEAVIQLRAKRIWVDEDEPDRPRDPPWSVFLYLDGDLVAWARPTLKGEPVEVRRVLKAGRREMRVVLQRYEKLRDGWLQESLSVPILIGFEVMPGIPAEIDVEMTRIWDLWRQRKDGGPLSYVIRQANEILAEHDGTGGDPDRWQPVCEDVEANFVGAETVPKRFRNSLSRCIRWAELWTGAGKSIDRSEILTDLAKDDFEPPIR